MTSKSTLASVPPPSSCRSARDGIPTNPRSRYDLAFNKYQGAALLRPGARHEKRRTPYLIPPGTPKELVQILRSAMKKTFQDPEFDKEAKKLTGEDPTPLMPEAQEELIRAVPRDVETVELFKLINGTNPLPPR